MLIVCVAAALSGARAASGSVEAATGSSKARTSAQKLTLYSALKNELFINNVDDLARGEGHNPFGNFSSLPPPTNEKVSGPFAGDEGVFALDLYRGADLKGKAGSAVFVCWYNFNQNAFCDASFRLNDGTLIGKGPLSFNSSQSTLAITGGASKYRSMKGAVQMTALGNATQAQPVYRAVPMLQTQRLDFAIQPAPATRPRAITVYSDPAHEAFVANADDQARGAVNNPFGVHISKAAAGLNAKDGPYAGDEALFSFIVYTDQNLTTKTGSAVYTCQYYFDKNAFCDASFQLNGGTLIAAGTLNFNAKKFGLAITGGSGKYSGVTGDIEATASGKTAQRLAFTLD